MNRFKQSVDGEKYIAFSTFRKDGREVTTPVWFVEFGDSLAFYAERRSGKIKRLRNSPRSRLAACNFKGAVHGEWLDSLAYLVAGDEAVKIAQALQSKYGIQVRIANLMSRLSGKFHGRQYVRIDAADG